MNKAILLPLAAALALSGCSMVPEYLRPAAPVPSDWPTQANGKNAIKFSDDWKAFFPDPTLQVLISTALEHNRDLRIAVGRVDEARALAGLARADRFPTVDVNAQRSAGLTPADLSATGRELSFQRYDAAFSITAFELDFWGRVKALDDAARASFLSSEYAQRSFRLSLISDVASAYFSLRELEQRTALSEATAKTREETRFLIEKRRDVGLAGDLDFYSADGVWQAARAETANLARQKAAAENALRLLVGSSLGSVVKPAPPIAGTADQAPTYVAPAEIAVELPSEVLLRRPDVLAAEQKLIAANANIGAARAAFFPRISLTGSLGLASTDLSGLFENTAWTFTGQLLQPLFDAGRNQATLDATRAAHAIAVAQYEKAIQVAFREVADVLAGRATLDDQLAALQAQVQAEARRVELADLLLRGGVASQIDRLDAERSLLIARQAVVLLQQARLQNSVLLYRVLGGGAGPARVAAR